MVAFAGEFAGEDGESDGKVPLAREVGSSLGVGYREAIRRIINAKRSAVGEGHWFARDFWSVNNAKGFVGGFVDGEDERFADLVAMEGVDGIDGFS